MTYGPSIPYIECGNLLLGSPTFTIWFKCGNLVTVNDLYGPPYHIWKVEPCKCQWLMVHPYPICSVGTLSWGLPHLQWFECGNLVNVSDFWFSLCYMKCGNLLTINDFYFFHTLYEMWEPCNGPPTCIMWEPCNCQWLMVPIPYMECGTIVAANDSDGPPIPYMCYGTITNHIINTWQSQWLVSVQMFDN